jgi:patatin-like phospholipase/acyl hydrolase
MAFNYQLEPNGETGKRLTILSIEGGGVRGIIPARILEELEDQLKALERLGNTGQHHLWEYFDMIAGTSSGGLITAMITTPSSPGSRQPCCNTTEVVEFFDRDAAKIFPPRFTNTRRLRWVLEGVASVLGPIYSATPLQNLLVATFRTACLSEALTSVIIPAFDTVNQIPVFFSNLRGVVGAEPLYNVHVTDACRATTAAPIFFPAAAFQEVPGPVNQLNVPRMFNVIDGGIAVNDPTLVAVAQAIAKRRPRARMDFRNVLVLSLGTGQHPTRFVARPHSSSVEWLLNCSGLPLLSSFFFCECRYGRVLYLHDIRRSSI